MKINTRIYKTDNKVYKSDERLKQDLSEGFTDKRIIKNIIQCHSFKYQGNNIGYIEFKKEDKEYYEQQLKTFGMEKTTEIKTNKAWVNIEIDDSKAAVVSGYTTGSGKIGILKFTGRANFKASTDEFRFKVKSTGRVGHVDYKDTRMIIDIEKPEEVNLNDYPPFGFYSLGGGERLYLECPNKQSFADFFQYIKAGEEYVVDLKDIWYEHKYEGSWGDTNYRIYQSPNSKKVIRKVGEESVPKKPDQQEAQKLAAFCQQVRDKINEVLNQDLVVFSSELNDNNWVEILNNAKTEQEINELKDRVLVDIETKRQVKKGKRKRENEREGDVHDNNKKPKLDDEDKKNYEDFLKNGILNEVEDNKLKSGLEVAIRLEGEKEYDDEKTRKEIEAELWKRNPQLCRNAIVAALKERLKDSNINTDELSEEVKKLINGEITNEDEVKTVKEQAIKEIGQKGAERKWTSLFNRAQSFLEQAKKNITEKVKENLKTIQAQIKSLSSETNAYLASFYSSNKDQVEKLEKDISTTLNQNQTGSEPKGTPWGIIIPISLVVVLVVVAIVLLKKRKKNR